MKKCSRCAKPSTLHVTEIRDGRAEAVHLCESCAQEYLAMTQGSEPSGGAEGLAEKLSELAEEGQYDELDQKTCPNCGVTFREFRSRGRLGCPYDYVAFESELRPLLENIHGEVHHAGKIPHRGPDDSQQQYDLIRLRNQLRAAVENENYEEAARLRDEISACEGVS